MYFKDVLGNGELKKNLIKEVANGRIPHAQLFHDSSQCGMPVALAFSMYLFCDNKSTNDSCGSCSSCCKMLKLTHPDLHFFYPTIGYTKESGSKATFSQFQKLILNDAYLRLADSYFMLEDYKRANKFYTEAKKVNLFDIDYAMFQQIKCYELLSDFVYQKEIMENFLSIYNSQENSSNYFISIF